MFVYVFFPTGAILGFMLGVFQIPLNECDDLYRKLGSDVFKQNVIVGTVKMGWNHAFYDSEAWENILKSVRLSLMAERWLCLFNVKMPRKVVKPFSLLFFTSFSFFNVFFLDYTMKVNLQ